jgi:hypothetical protein
MAQTLTDIPPRSIDSDVRALLGSDIEALAQGECWLGVAKEEITPEGVEPLAGFSLSGSRGRPGRDRLWARALYVEDLDTGQSALICVVDLLSASSALLEAVENELSARGRADLVGRVILSGTHTHTAPGRFFGNRFYDRLAAPIALGGFQRALTRRLAQKIARACLGAVEQRRRGELSVQRAEVWGAGRNRSIEAFRANGADPEAPRPAWGPAPPELNEEEQAVDPRVSVWCARVEGTLTGVFAWFGCHGTALGRKWKYYHRDWLGVAVDLAERELDGALCAVGSGASGDVTPLPSTRPPSGAPPSARAVPKPRASESRASDQTLPGPVLSGLALAEHVGQRVGARIVAVARAAKPASGRRLRLTLDAGVFEVDSEGSTPRWQIGVPVLGGSEDGGPSFRRLQFVAEGFRGDSGVQRPKAPALGFLQALTLGPLDIGRYHAWHRLRVGEHVLCTVPGEPTVTAALTLERQVVAQLGAASASIIGYSGDYAGYFTTTAEYCKQHYEGASTLYGPRSLDWYGAQLLGPSRRRPSAPSAVSLPSGAIPQRNVQRLLGAAHELEAGTDHIELLFAVEREAGNPEREARPHPRVWLRALSETARAGSTPAALHAVGAEPSEQAGIASASMARRTCEGVCRPHDNPDPDGAGGLQTFVASFERARVTVSGLELSRAELVIGHGPAQTRRAIALHAQAEQNGRWPGTVSVQPSFGGVRRALLALGAFCFSVALLLLAHPAAVLVRLGWMSAPMGVSTAFERLMTRNIGLTFLLLGVNLLVAKNSRDRRALASYVWACALFAGAIALFAGVAQHDVLAAAVSGGAALGLLVFGGRLSPRGARRPTPPRAHWEFWTPLFWLGLLTLAGGALLVFFPGWFGRSFGIEDPTASHWLRLYGAGFWVNTLGMWGCRYTRDLRVVSAQLWGSLLFDSLSPALLAVAIAGQVLNPLGLVLLLPFLAIVAWLRVLLGRVHREAHLEIERPRSVRELGRIVRDARREKKLVRVIGSRHSAPLAIFGDAPPCPRGRRPSDARCVHVSLDALDRIVDVDRARRRISVQAGMRIGVDPGHADSADNNLLLHLRELGWALGDLGGIVHQTLGGFLATGSSGGSVSHAFQDAVVELRCVDASGRARVARRGAAGDEGELFEALSVSMGLLGIITEVTLECEALYHVEGRELTALVRDGVVHVPADPGAGALGSPRTIRLTSPGGDGLGAYLSERGHRRILWWPQAAIRAMALWEGWRTDRPARVLMPYRAPKGALQFVAGRVLELLGWSYGVGNSSIVGNWLRRTLLPTFVRQFLPKHPVRFHAAWDDNLPMDTHVDQAFLPVEFTELWFDIRETHRVMETMLAMYEENDDLAGTFAVELYAAKKSDSWLSPSHGRDSFRVDIFWYQRNAGDPVVDYYPAFYERLAALAFRAHWGKYLPQPGSACGADYLAASYPRWQDFARRRRELDPDGTFLSVYWRRHLDFS